MHALSYHTISCQYTEVEPNSLMPKHRAQPILARWNIISSGTTFRLNWRTVTLVDRVLNLALRHGFLSVPTCSRRLCELLFKRRYINLRFDWLFDWYSANYTILIFVSELDFNKYILTWHRFTCTCMRNYISRNYSLSGSRVFMFYKTNTNKHAWLWAVTY